MLLSHRIFIYNRQLRLIKFVISMMIFVIPVILQAWVTNNIFWDMAFNDGKFTTLEDWNFHIELILHHMFLNSEVTI